MKQKFYLAHPVRSREYVRKWQKKIERTANIQLINPFFEGSPKEVKLAKKIAKKKLLPYLTKAECNSIVQSDLKLILECGHVVGIIDGNTSYGTLMELFFAKSVGAGVLLIVTNGFENHPWLNFVSNHIFTSFEGANRYFNSWFKK